MNFVSRFVFRLQPQIRQFSYNRYNIQHFTTSMQLSVKYGKLINDHVTSTFFLPVGEDGDEMAAVMYEKQKGLLNLHHTEVPERFRDEGVGNDLAKEVFEYCSARNLKVLLTCEFLQKFYEQNPQYKDLVVVREKMNI